MKNTLKTIVDYVLIDVIGFYPYCTVLSQIFIKRKAALICKKLSCQSHKLLVSWYILFGKMPLSNQVSGFNTIVGCPC